MEKFSGRRPTLARKDADEAAAIARQLHLARKFQAECHAFAGAAWSLEYEAGKDRGKLDEAIAAYQRAIDTEPSHPRKDEWQRAINSLKAIKAR